MAARLREAKERVTPLLTTPGLLAQESLHYLESRVPASFLRLITPSKSDDGVDVGVDVGVDEKEDDSTTDSFDTTSFSNKDASLPHFKLSAHAADNSIIAPPPIKLPPDSDDDASDVEIVTDAADADAKGGDGGADEGEGGGVDIKELLSGLPPWLCCVLSACAAFAACVVCLCCVPRRVRRRKRKANEFAERVMESQLENLKIIVETPRHSLSRSRSRSRAASRANTPRPRTPLAKKAAGADTKKRRGSLSASGVSVSGIRSEASSMVASMRAMASESVRGYAMDVLHIPRDRDRQDAAAGHSPSKSSRGSEGATQHSSSTPNSTVLKLKSFLGGKDAAARHSAPLTPTQRDKKLQESFRVETKKSSTNNGSQRATNRDRDREDVDSARGERDPRCSRSAGGSPPRERSASASSARRHGADTPFGRSRRHSSPEAAGDIPCQHPHRHRTPFPVRNHTSPNCHKRAAYRTYDDQRASSTAPNSPRVRSHSQASSFMHTAKQTRSLTLTPTPVSSLTYIATPITRQRSLSDPDISSRLPDHSSHSSDPRDDAHSPKPRHGRVKTHMSRLKHRLQVRTRPQASSFTRTATPTRSLTLTAPPTRSPSFTATPITRTRSLSDPDISARLPDHSSHSPEPHEGVHSPIPRRGRVKSHASRLKHRLQPPALPSEDRSNSTPPRITLRVTPSRSKTPDPSRLAQRSSHVRPHTALDGRATSPRLTVRMPQRSQPQTPVHSQAQTHAHRPQAQTHAQRSQPQTHAHRPQAQTHAQRSQPQTPVHSQPQTHAHRSQPQTHAHRSQAQTPVARSGHTTPPSRMMQRAYHSRPHTPVARYRTPIGGYSVSPTSTHSVSSASGSSAPLVIACSALSASGYSTPMVISNSMPSLSGYSMPSASSPLSYRAARPNDRQALNLPTYGSTSDAPLPHAYGHDAQPIARHLCDSATSRPSSSLTYGSHAQLAPDYDALPRTSSDSTYARGHDAPSTHMHNVLSASPNDAPQTHAHDSFHTQAHTPSSAHDYSYGHDSVYAHGQDTPPTPPYNAPSAAAGYDAPSQHAHDSMYHQRLGVPSSYRYSEPSSLGDIAASSHGYSVPSSTDGHSV